MAITRADCVLWRELRRADLIPEEPTVLEIGRANWYGDVPADEFDRDRQEFAPEDAWTPACLDAWTRADWYYRVMLRKPIRAAVDLDPHAPDCERSDLNYPLGLVVRQHDLVINTGTTEHVFDQRQVWETIHDATKVGGLMVHSLPLWGWLDHGFVNYQPTFVEDVAAENDYDIVLWLFAEIQPLYAKQVTCAADFAALLPRSKRRSAMMHVALRKTKDTPFRVPLQGIYSSRTTPEQSAAWRTNRLPLEEDTGVIDRQAILEQMEQIAAERRQHEADLQALNGAMTLCRGWLRKLDEQDEAERRRNGTPAEGVPVEN